MLRTESGHFCTRVQFLHNTEENMVELCFANYLHSLTLTLSKAKILDQKVQSNSYCGFKNVVHYIKELNTAQFC